MLANHATTARSLLLGLGLVIAGCSGGPAGSGGPTEVGVTLTDFRIEASTATVSPGQIRLAITNQGAVVHEVEVFTVPEGVNPDALPAAGDVADTESAQMTVVDEVEDVAPSTVTSLTVTLTPGRYALICNLPTHYGLGMHTTLTVR